MEIINCVYKKYNVNTYATHSGITYVRRKLSTGATKKADQIESLVPLYLCSRTKCSLSFLINGVLTDVSQLIIFNY